MSNKLEEIARNISSNVIDIKQFEILIYECLNYCNEKNNTNIRVKGIYLNDWDEVGFAVTDYNEGNNFKLIYGSRFLTKYNENHLYNVNKYMSITTGFRTKNIVEIYVSIILHEIGHMDRLYKDKFSFGRYSYQKSNLDIWENKQLKNRKMNSIKLEHMGHLKYRKIEEEKMADIYAKENIDGCLKYLRKRGVI